MARARSTGNVNKNAQINVRETSDVSDTYLSEEKWAREWVFPIQNLYSKSSCQVRYTLEIFIKSMHHHKKGITVGVSSEIKRVPMPCP